MRKNVSVSCTKDFVIPLWKKNSLDLVLKITYSDIGNLYYYKSFSAIIVIRITFFLFTQTSYKLLHRKVFFAKNEISFSSIPHASLIRFFFQKSQQWPIYLWVVYDSLANKLHIRRQHNCDFCLLFSNIWHKDLFWQICYGLTSFLLLFYQVTLQWYFLKAST